MPTRLIWESATTSETLALLSAEEERHFWRLIVHADDFGRFDARPHVIRAKSYAALLDKVTEEKAEGFTQGLFQAGLIQLYTNTGRRYGFLVNWERFQRVRNKRSRYPDPAADGSELLQPAAIVAKTRRNPNPNPNPNPKLLPPLPPNSGSELLSRYSEDELTKIRDTHPGIDLELESDHCVLWWKESTKVMQRPKSAFTTWLKNWKPGHSNGQHPAADRSRRVEAHPPGYWDGKEQW